MTVALIDGRLDVGQGLELRPAFLCDADEFVASQLRNLDYLVEAGEEEPCVGPQDFYRRFNDMSRDFLTGYSQEYLTYLTNRLVGGMGLHPWSAGSLELSGWVDKNYQSQGIATRAARAACDYAFAACNVRAIYLQINSDNDRSQAVATKLGAVKYTEHSFEDKRIQVWRTCRGQ